jgi:hypothetical protein
MLCCHSLASKLHGATVGDTRGAIVVDCISVSDPWQYGRPKDWVLPHVKLALPITLYLHGTAHK